jgi:hypothetical protein
VTPGERTSSAGNRRLSDSGILTLMETPENNEDTQNVTANFGLPDEVMQAVTAGG